jgi:DNA-binding NarL/FixJ family response regulator
MTPGDTMTPRKIRVVIAEDHAVVREGTRQILATDPAIEVVGEAGDGETALALVLDLLPDILVLDLRLPAMSGIEVAERLQACAATTSTLVLSAYDDDDYVFAAMEAGASGYLLKTAHGQEVIEAIHAIAHGEVILQATVAAKLIHGRQKHASFHQEECELTGRELEILRLASMGMRNKEIAERLFLSQRTIESHLSHIFTKLGVDSRTQAVMTAAGRGWLAAPHSNG